MAMRPPKTELTPPPSPPSDERDAVIHELWKGTQLAELLKQQVELIPQLDRRKAALANVADISVSLESSLHVLRSEREQFCSTSSSEAGAVAAMAAPAPAACGSDGGGVRQARHGGAVPRSRKARLRRGKLGEEFPIKEILTEGPENDQFHWRKYGEKKILNAAFPRLYYRCGYSDEHKCPAKKYVQRQESSNPAPLFMVTFINEHTCGNLFPDQPSSSSSASQVLDFTKASLSPPLMAPSTVGDLRLKKEEEVMPVTMLPRDVYDEFCDFAEHMGAAGNVRRQRLFFSRTQQVELGS